MNFFTYTESAHIEVKWQNIGLSHVVSLIFIVCVIFLTSHRIAIAETVRIPDPNLRTALELALGKEAGADITQTDMASLESLDAFESGIFNLTSLEFAINLTGLHLGLNHVSDVSPLKDLTKLTVLDLHRNEAIVDVSPLKDLTNLTWLSLRGNRILDAFPLKDLTNLTYLHIAYNRISDVSPFKDLTNLTFLDLEVNQISDLSPLKDLINLTYLDFDSTRVSDLSPIRTLIKLDELDASDNLISDISVLKDLTNLTYLDLDDNQISDISPLKNLTKLMILDLDDNQILDVSPLRDLTKLKWLDLDHSQITDVSPLKDLINLTYLDLNDNEVSDVSPLKGMTKLTELDIDSNKVSDISSLKDLTELTILDLHGNKILDVSALRNMTKLTVLDLDDNHISDISPLENLTNLTELDLDGNKILDVSPLRNMTKLTVLDLHDNHIFDFSPIAGLIENLIEYDNSNQTEPPPNLRTEPTSNRADVNRDGVVNITDLVVIASNFHDPDLNALASLKIYPDVNNDGVVDLIDLLIVASEIGAKSAAPVLSKNSVETANLTIENLAQWIRLSKQLDVSQPHLQNGIAVLESLLALLSTIETLPKETALLQNYPNPFNPETWFPFQLAKPAKVIISIYAADGKHVRKLALGQLPAGVYQHKSRAAYWDGKNEFGEPVASGVYFYTLTTDNFSATRKMFIRK